MDFRTPSQAPPTRLIELPLLARQARVAHVWVKAECDRQLGNFKALGGIAAALKALARAGGGARRTLVCASDGNHGLAVAAAARMAGSGARIFLPAGASALRVARIAAQGAQVEIVHGTYDDAVNEAAAAASRGEGLLVPDTSDNPNDAAVHDVMDGYAQLSREVLQQMRGLPLPTHVFAQAGVGGLAASLASGLAAHLRAPGRMVVVEPAQAACVAAGLRAGRPVRLAGDLATCAEMLSCGTASAAALAILLRAGAGSVTVDEAALHGAPAALADGGGPATTPSGAAGLAGLLHAAGSEALRAAHGLDGHSSVLLVVTEGVQADLAARGRQAPANAAPSVMNHE